MSARTLSAGMQENLLSMLCFHDGPRGAKLVSTLVPHQSYDPHFREIAKEASDYIAKYGKPPADHTMDIVGRLKEKNPKLADVYDKICRAVLRARESINVEYVLSQATLFQRHQRCKGTIERAFELWEAGNIDKCEAEMASINKPLNGTHLFDVGLTLNDPNQALDFLTREDNEKIPTGIKELDERGICPAKGEDFLFIAPKGAGKSWMAVHCGKHAILSRASVLHISLEMDRNLVAQRYIQSMFAVTRRQATEVIVNKFKHKKGTRYLSRIVEEKIDDILSFQNPDILKTLSKKIKSTLQRRPRLKIVDFPSGSLTIPQLESYLENLEAIEGFCPEEIILDYGELMKLDPKNIWVDMARTHVELRGLAHKRNFALLNFSQVTKTALEAKYTKGSHVAGSREKIDTADVAVTYNQTDEEHRMGLARLKTLYVRNEEKHDEIAISQCYALGQFCLSSARMRPPYWDHVKDNTQEE